MPLLWLTPKLSQLQILANGTRLDSTAKSRKMKKTYVKQISVPFVLSRVDGRQKDMFSRDLLGSKLKMRTTLTLHDFMQILKKNANYINVNCFPKANTKLFCQKKDF